MSTRTQAALALLAALLLGVVLGGVLGGALQRVRERQLADMRRPGGFADHMERIIQPRDEEQRLAIRPVLEATERRNEEIVRENHRQLRDALRSMRAELAPILDQEQTHRLEKFEARGPDPLRPPPR